MITSRTRWWYSTRETTHPPTRFTWWNMLIPWSALISSHPNTYFCARGVERKRLQLTSEVDTSREETEFWSFIQILDKSGWFKYLGYLPMTTNDDWPADVANLRKDLKKWEPMSRILGQEGAYTGTFGTFFKTDVQADLLFHLDIWVTTPQI